MTMKKFELEKRKALKIASRMKDAAGAGRFGAAPAEAVDRREQRKRDAAAGLVPFACKLPEQLASRLRAEAEARGVDVGVVVAERLEAAG